jgi:endonuclease/exonuclease/phosphatase family metal-dependent hydrolase
MYLRNTVVTFALLLFLLPTSVLASFKIGTYNIRNFDYDQRYDLPTDKNKLYGILNSMDFDLLAVQEINKKEVFKNFIGSRFSQYGVAMSNCGGAHKQHLGFVYNRHKLKLLGFKEDMRLTVYRPDQQPKCYDGSRPAAIAYFVERDTGIKFVAMSLHLKSGGNSSSIEKRFIQFKTLEKIMGEFKQQGIKNFVLMGDLNTTEYIKGPSNPNHNRFRAFVKHVGMINASKDIRCSSYWWGGIDDQKEYPSQLDHVLISKNMITQGGFYPQTRVGAHCNKFRCGITPTARMNDTYKGVSDHCPILTDL